MTIKYDLFGNAFETHHVTEESKNWPWAYTKVTQELYQDLMAVYPNLFHVMSAAYVDLSNVCLQFRCEQLPVDMKGQWVTFKIERYDNQPIVTFERI